MKIALLALQGDFAEHEAVFRALGAETLQLRQSNDLQKKFDALILPGGESTVQGKLLRDLGMFESLRKMIEEGKIAEAEKFSKEVYAYIDSACSKGVIHKNAASRKVGRLAALLFKAKAATPVVEAKVEKKED